MGSAFPPVILPTTTMAIPINPPIIPIIPTQLTHSLRTARESTSRIVMGIRLTMTVLIPASTRWEANSSSSVFRKYMSTLPTVRIIPS